MKYGWLGKQAAFCVDKELKVDEYTDFINFAKGYQDDVKLLVEKKGAVMAVPEEASDPDDKRVALKRFFAPLKTVPAAIVNSPGKAINAINMRANSEKIESQQYTCTVLMFYLNGLKEFLRM